MTPKKGLRLVGYARVSTEEQAREGVSIAAQRSKLRAYAELHECELVEVLEDKGLSASTLERPGLERALELLRSGQVEGLVVAKLDRLTRRTRDLLELVEELCQERGLALVSIAENVDTTTASGRLMLTVLGALASWERETIQERTRDVLAHLRAEGVRMGAAGLGWRYAEELDSEGRRVVVAVPEEKRIERRIRNLRGRGYSLRAIAARLEADGVPTKRGGTHWHAKVVRDALGEPELARSKA